MNRITLHKKYVRTLDWLNEQLVDWNSAGTTYSLLGESIQTQKYHFGFVCDGSITSPCGNFAVIYQKLGTKALLLKNGEVHREINRSYYQYDAYEFPITFFEFRGKTYLAHCPSAYNQLDFEDAETGEIMTQTDDRNSCDFFHSRLEMSPDHKTLISKGWVWHPFDFIQIYDIESCFNNPSQLDSSLIEPNVEADLSTASFINNDLILIGAVKGGESFAEGEPPSGNLRPGQIAIWNIRDNSVTEPIALDFDFGNLFVIDENFAWDLFSYPKIINYKTGEIVSKIEDINSGKQCSSIIHHLKDLPKIAFNKVNKKIAIANKDSIEILERPT